MLLHTLKPAPLSVRSKQVTVRPRSTDSQSAGSVEATSEINAYLALRDMYLAESEETPSSANVARAERANDFVEKLLKPARSPYQAQALPEADAVRERVRCNTVKDRLTALRGQLQPA
ncbi:MAG: hypothetical protein ACR2HH_05615 [Chthoniobacterales bacterium]